MNLIKTPESLKGKPYPKFIKEHLIFKAFPDVDKVFPKIGLHNGKADTKTLLTGDEIDADGISKVAEFRRLIAGRLTRLRNEPVNQYCGQDGYRQMSDTWKTARRSIITLLTTLCMQMTADPKAFIRRTKKSFSVSASETITSGKYSIRKGKLLLTEIDRLHTDTRGIVSHGINLPGLSVREPSAERGIPVRSKIVFTSSGKEGLWDMATMSMRGITSCQRWNNPDYAHRLIGSMIDPCAGIIYIEKGKTKHGSKMVRRAVVRFVINRKSRKPALLVERIYPRGLSEEQSKGTFELFAKFLSAKTNDRYAIIYGDSGKDVLAHFIPLSEPVMHLRDDNDNDTEEVSYRDSGISYKELPRDISQYIK